MAKNEPNKPDDVKFGLTTEQTAPPDTGDTIYSTVAVFHTLDIGEIILAACSL